MRGILVVTLAVNIFIGVVSSIQGDSSETATTPNYPSADEDPLLNQDCIDDTGEVGQCLQFKDCYPILYRLGEVGRSNTNSQLVSDVLEASTPCSPRGETGPNSNNIICCTSSVASNVDSSKNASIVVATTPAPPTITPVISRPAVGNEIEDSNTRVQSKNPQTSAEPPLVDSSNCVSTLVVNYPAPLNEANAPRGAYPWMAALMNNRNMQFCGGSLIDNYHVLTAAHCIAHIVKKPEQLSKMKVLFGVNNLIFPESSKMERGVVKIIQHSEYSDKNFTNDIALLRLSKAVPFDRYIQPLCLNKESDTYSDGTKMATLAGWGRTSVIGGPSPVLRHGTMKIWKNEDCQKRYDEFFGSEDIPKVQPKMVCAGSPGVDACQGDSGGPLFMKKGDIYEQVGVVSWGIGCGIYPGVYTRVDQYIGWVNANRGVGVVETVPSTEAPAVAETSSSTDASKSLLH